jgi:Flp pilus assembly protein TadD
VELLLRVAEFYQRGKQYEAAEKMLHRARGVKPREVQVLFQLGAVLERQKKHAEAEGAFKSALEVEPESPQVLNYLGYMNAERGVDLEHSLAMIDRALALDPENGAYLDSRGWALYRLRRLEQAEEALRQAVAKEGESAVILDHLAETLRARGKVQEALKVWKRALAGEDEEGELDRARVEEKIKEAQSLLEAQR